MQTRIVVLMALLVGGAAQASDPAERAYQAARHGYYVLKADAARRKHRDNWLAVAHRFEAVAGKYPRSVRAPDALFTAGQLLEALSRISFMQGDLDGAMADYESVLKAHPRDRLADDAALALARAQLDRRNDPEGARKTLRFAFAQIPRGDKWRSLHELWNELPAARAESRVRSASPAPVPVVAAAGHEPMAAGSRTEGRPLAPAVPGAGRPAAAPAVSGEDHAGATSAAKVASAPVNPKQQLKKLASARSAELTLAEQLGLKVRRVVIDAGHGGHDAGAVGPDGVREKDVTLQIAKRVAKTLEVDGLQVIMTRDSDSFVRLEDRTRIANEAKGDLFISIHCNSAPEKRDHGVETYVLNTASDRYSLRLAARENAVSERGISDLQFILADLATKANTDESIRLAYHVQRDLVSRLSAKYAKVRDLGDKQALFYVLLGAKMPAILVETSFLSNPEEEHRLTTDAYQQDVAQAIASGVQDFLGTRQRLAKMDGPY